MTKSPLFIRYLNGESGVLDIINSIARAEDPKTRDVANKALQSPPNLDEFKKELKDAVLDIIREGPGNEFVAFVNNYMPCLEEDITMRNTPRGENRSQIARIKDENGPWIQAFICYNLSLYIKAFGLENLKSCRVCNKFFDNKGKYAVYCNDACKKRGKDVKKSEQGPEA